MIIIMLIVIYNKEFFDVMDTRTEIGIYATEGILFS